MSFAVSSPELADLYYEEHESDSGLEQKASSYPKR